MTRLADSARRGSSFLEVQVATIVFAIAMSGVAPLMVFNSRQAAALREQLPDSTPQYLVPTGQWQSKLGGGAEVHDAPVSATSEQTVVDDGDSSYSENGDFIYEFAAATYGGDFRYMYPLPMPTHYARWELDLRPGVYLIQVTFPTENFLTTNASYRIFDDASLLGITYLNHQNRTAGDSASWGGAPPIASNSVSGGLTWTSLGTFTIESGTLQVQLKNVLTSWCTIDAMRVIPLRNNIDLQSVTHDRAADSISTQVLVTP